jgi:hypothetical protein
MDNYLDKKRFSNYYLTMANLEARQLYNEANFASLIYLKDGLTRLNFIDEINTYINNQLEFIRLAKTESECLECLHNLKKERDYISIQERLLQTGEATLQASVEFIKNDDVWHWIINGVGVVLGSAQLIAGVGITAASGASGNIIGVAFGAMLVLHGGNSIQEGVMNLYKGTDNSTGTAKRLYIAGAEFLGFDRRAGELAYYSCDLALSAYGMSRLILKPDTWRLFRYLPTDYVRGIKTMGRLDLGMEIYNNYTDIKSILNR